MKIVTVQQMQAIEKSADSTGLSYAQMMHHAGLGVGAWVGEKLDLRQGVVGLVGSGNNGGDTLIALTSLAMRGARTAAFLAKDRGEDPLLTAYDDLGGQVVDISSEENMDLLQAAIQPGTIILDGVLGTGLRLPLRGALLGVMAKVYGIVKERPGALVVAVDCPSGMDCDTGEVAEVTLKSDFTLSMAAVKQGLLKYPGRGYAGQLQWIGIGITDIHDHIVDPLPEMIHAELVRKFLPERPKSGHKGTFGTCQVVAGTRAFSGAAYLTGKAAYRAGCGLVDMATLPGVQNQLAGSLVEAVWTILPKRGGAYDPQGVEILGEKLLNADALIFGPGFGLAESTASLVHQLIEAIPKKCPVLIDADGLKLLSQLKNWWQKLPENVILTPHPGEMSILTGLSVDKIQADRWNLATRYAKDWGVTVILKGAVTVIATQHGDVFINPTSDPSLATAGSGDVLSGMIGGLLAQGTSQVGASVAGVWLHTQAGLKASARLGTTVSVMATDILEHVPAAFQSIRN